MSEFWLYFLLLLLTFSRFYQEREDCSKKYEELDEKYQHCVHKVFICNVLSTILTDCQVSLNLLLLLRFAGKTFMNQASA